MRAYDPALALGAQLRLTRLLTTDVMGGYLVVGPLERLRDRTHADRCRAHAVWDGWKDLRHDRRCRALSLVLEGLDCPHCCGLWISTALTVTYAATSRDRWSRAVWRAVCAALTLGYAGGHICSRVDGTDDPGPAVPQPG